MKMSSLEISTLMEISGSSRSRCVLALQLDAAHTLGPFASDM